VVRQTGRRRPALQLGVLALAAVMLLLVPLVFLTNVNLMLFPERWGGVRGFWSAALLPNVVPRYLHFVCATLAATGPLTRPPSASPGSPGRSCSASATAWRSPPRWRSWRWAPSTSSPSPGAG
jgi:hypothetical protein